MIYRRTVIVTKKGLYHIEDVADKEVEIWEPYSNQWEKAFIYKDTGEFPLTYLQFKNGLQIHVSNKQIINDRNILDIKQDEFLEFVENIPDCGIKYGRKVIYSKTELDFPEKLLASDIESKKKLNELITYERIYFKWYAFSYLVFLNHIGIKAKIISDRYVFDEGKFHFHYKYFPNLVIDNDVEINVVDHVLSLGYYTDVLYSVIGPKYFTLGNGLIVNGNENW